MGGEPARLRLISGPPWPSVLTMALHGGAVSRLASLPDGRIVSGSQDHTVRLWDPRTGQVATMDQHQGAVFAVAWCWPTGGS